MRHARVLAVSALAVSLLAAVAVAQTSITPLPDNGPIKTASLEVDFSKTTWGDPKAGQTKAAACTACHSADGNSTVEMYPSIAGQSERYSAQQDMRDIGAYFATQKATAGIADDGAVTEGPYAGKKFYEIGQQLYRGGDAERGIPACMACHGPTGAGNPGPAYPHISGQHSAYVARRLQEYQAGTTQETDKAHFQIMATIAKSLTEQEIQALASYLQGLHNRADDVATAAPPVAGGTQAP